MDFMRLPSSLLALKAIFQIKVNHFQYYHCYYFKNHGQKKKKKSTRVRERVLILAFLKKYFSLGII